MKTLRIPILTILFLSAALAATVAAEAPPKVPLERLEPPASDKAAVYFFLPGKTPAIPTISIFDNGTQLPNLLGAREYARYEVDPGMHTFIVQPMIPGVPSFDQWVHGDLEPGGIYAALVSGFLADLVVYPLTGRMDPEYLINMKIEERQWERVAGLIDAKPPKPPGKERKHSMNPEVIAGFEAKHPTSAFDNLVRLNPTAELSREFPLDQLPDPVPDRSVVTFFVPQHKPDQLVTVFDEDRRLGPDLEGGKVYTYETAPGPTRIWVREVGVDFTRYRVASGNLEPGQVYAILVSHSLGNGGARLLSLSGKPETRISFIPEPELWSELDDLRDVPRDALQRTEPVEAQEMKGIAKKLKKKTKKRRTEFTPLR